MTIDLLIEALQMLKDRGDNPDYKDRVIHDSLTELKSLRSDISEESRRIWKGAVHVVSMSNALDLQNALLYDTYGKLAREYDDNVPFLSYIAAARAQFGFDEASIAFLRSGYDFLSDLWGDNEVNGNNGPDGTFATTPPKFKVLGWDYSNTGGSCMVGALDVYMYDIKQVRTVLVNEEGAVLSYVDYINHDLEIDDYDELMIETVDWSTCSGHEKYFELYRHALNRYLQADCRYFKYTKDVPYHLLSDELQRKVPDGYVEWAEHNNNSGITTNGFKIIVSDDFNPPA